MVRQRDRSTVPVNGCGDSGRRTRKRLLGGTRQPVTSFITRRLCCGRQCTRTYAGPASRRACCASVPMQLPVGSLAYIVDYHVAPARLRPGFKKHLGPRSIFAVYAAFAAGLALVTFVRQRAARRRTERLP